MIGKQYKGVINTLALFAIVISIPVIICILTGDTTTALALGFLYIGYLIIISLFVVLVNFSGKE